MNLPTYGIALVAPGLERVCASELDRLGLPEEGRMAGRVRFNLGRNPVDSLLRANLWLRTADRVLAETAAFPAKDFGELYDGIAEVPWELYIRKDDWPVVDKVRIHQSTLSAQTSVQSVVHKAILERLCRHYRLSRMDPSGRPRSIRIYFDKDWCTAGMDSSGDALSRRGYRREGGVAPLKETLAAGLLFLSGWSRRLDFLDPFCGSGTLAIEAALYALNRAPGLGRSFDLESMPIASESGLGTGREQAQAMIKADARALILATDADPDILRAAEANAHRAGCEGLIEFRKLQAEDATPPGPRGVLLCNPPYGERLGSPEEAQALYGRLSPLYRRFRSWGLGFMTATPDFGEYFGHRATPRKILNGAEEQWFHWYPSRE